MLTLRLACVVLCSTDAIRIFSNANCTSLVLSLWLGGKMLQYKIPIAVFLLSVLRF